MTDGNSTKNKSRGIIVVDTCCLISMCKKPKLSADKESFLDSLAYLAQHGFTIVIPEFVVIEITNKCPTRELETVLNKVKKTPLGHAENRQKFLDFLETNRDHIIIEKARPYDGFGNSLPHFRICEWVREAVEIAQPGYADTHEMPKNYNKDPQAYWEARIKSNIDKAMNATCEQRDLGEVHCFRVVVDRMVEDVQKNPDIPKTPIYFLSDDKISTKVIHDEFALPFKAQLKTLQNPPIFNFLTIAGFFRALDNDRYGKQTSILKRMGFKEKSQDILHLMYDDRRYNVAWSSPKRDQAIFTQNPQYVPSSPFSEAIGSLRDELEQEEKINGAGSMADRYSKNELRLGRS